MDGMPVVGGSVETPMSASGFILRRYGVGYVPIIPQDSQALIAVLMGNRAQWDAMPTHGF
jgi:hypothetical protein